MHESTSRLLATGRVIARTSPTKLSLSGMDIKSVWYEVIDVSIIGLIVLAIMKEKSVCVLFNRVEG